MNDIVAPKEGSREEPPHAPSRFEIYRELRSEVTYEANLAVSRTTWFVASQAFLFTSLTTGVKKAEPPVSISDSLLFPLVPYLGLVICILTFASVTAAISRARHISSKINGTFEDFVERYRIRENPLTNFFGTMSTFWMPIVFAVAWLFILGVKIRI